MLSCKMRILNMCLKYLIKPILRYYLHGYLTTKNNKFIHHLRHLVKLYPISIPQQAIIKQKKYKNVNFIEIQTESSAKGKIILYFHGGAFVLFPQKFYIQFCYHLSHAMKAKVILINYGLAPEYVFPSALEDSLLVYRWLNQTKSSAENIIFCGDSAGGGLALSTMVALKKANNPLPAAGIFLSPWTDLAITGASLNTNFKKDVLLSRLSSSFYVTADNIYNPLASPLYANFSFFPPLLFFVSDDEILLDDTLRIVNKARAQKVSVVLEKWSKMPHAWPIYSNSIPECQIAIKKMIYFINQIQN